MVVPSASLHAHQGWIGGLAAPLQVLADDADYAAKYPGVPYMYQRDYRRHTWIQKAGLSDALAVEL